MGASRIKKLKEAGIETPLDLCCRFPSRYIDLSMINRFDLFSEGDEIAGYGKITAIEKKIIRKNLSYIKVEFVTANDLCDIDEGKNNAAGGCLYDNPNHENKDVCGKSFLNGNVLNDNDVNNNAANNSNLNDSKLKNNNLDNSNLKKTSNGKFWATWFNQPFMTNVLKQGKECFIVGRLKIVAGRAEISAPTLVTPDKSSQIIPVYRSLGVPSAILKEAVKAALKEVKIDGFLNEDVRQKHGLMETQRAFFAAHFPKNLTDAKEARRSLSIENLAGYIARYHATRQNGTTNSKTHSYQNTHNPLLFNLPFELTADQSSAYKAITERLKASAPANILIEGDVGCGKTIVCFLAMNLAAQNGHQSVLMAPTEILARQHFLTAQKLFAPQKIAFLSGSQTSAQRAETLFNIEHGIAEIVIGTHSVFGKDVKYRDLTLVITDEQHKFGVMQRGALENKSFAPDRIVMSATPIPRTLALTLYGDLDIIALHQKPLEKARVYTRFVGEKVPQMYDYIKEKTVKGEQTIIVCPRIESDDESELVGAEKLYKELKPRFGELIGLLHGRMKDEDKTRVMGQFVAGTVKILVSTTIIEVGVDVPAATTIVIYNAERYGLSQLHQLRGRVGRGNIDGFCFLICGKEAYQSRLKFLAECEDGFELAEKDFAIRGAGDFLGLRQHGASLTFTGEPITLELLKLAKEISLFIKPDDLGDLSETELFFKELALN